MSIIWKIGIQQKEIKERKEREFKKKKERNIKSRLEIEFKSLSRREEGLHILQVEVLAKAIVKVEVEVKVKSKKGNQRLVRI